MSLLASFQKKSKLENAIRDVAKARKTDTDSADAIYKNAYETFAEVVRDDLTRAQALYNWGAGLFYQAKNKQGDEAVKAFQDAIKKFEFCSLIQPSYLAAAIDGGVCFMELARLKCAETNDELYNQAKLRFEQANGIQVASASYNLACIYGLRGDHEACLKALQEAKDKASLPDVAEILGDPDIACIKDEAWFLEFIESLTKQPEPELIENSEENISPEQTDQDNQETVTKSAPETSETPSA